MFGGVDGNAGRAGDAEGGDARAGLDQHGVGVAVVAALELDHQVARGEAAGEADGGHAGFGAGGGEAEALDRRKALDDELGKVGLGSGGGAERRGVGGGAPDGFDDWRKGVAEDHGSPGVEEVEVAVAVDVKEEGSFGAVEEGGSAADGAEGADGRVDSAREEMLGAVLHVAGGG